MKLKINLHVGPVNILPNLSHYQTVVNFCSGNGLLCNAAKPLLESVLTILWHLLKEMSQKMLKLFIIKMFKNFTISRGLISYPLRPGDIYASVVIKAIIGSDNGLLPDWHQATTWINDILSIRPWGTHFKIIRNSEVFIQENAFENIVCEMAHILSQPQCANGIQYCWVKW